MMASHCKKVGCLSFTLLVITILTVECSNFESVPRYDGWYNNLDRKNWGASGQLLRRLVLSEYSDFTYQPSGLNRPAPRQISNDVFKGESGHPSYNNKTALFVFFGQMISHEMVYANSPTCPVELIKLDVPKGDPDFDSENEGYKHIPFYRSEYDKKSGQSTNSPRRQINKASSWIDGGFIYGGTRVWADTLRSFKGGRLKTHKDGVFPAWNDQNLPMINHPSSYDNTVRDPTTLWMLGNPFVHENPGLLSIALVWFWYHNHLADQYASGHPRWTDEQVYRQARKMTVATLQNIVMYEWLPILLGEDMQPYTGYKSEIEPDISVLFESAAIRQLATVVPPGIYIRNNKCEFKTFQTNHTALRLCNTYYKSQTLIEELDAKSFVMGMASQIAEREDNIVVHDIRGKNVGSLQFSRLDYVASTIMRGRDHGLPDYNMVRKEFGLSPIQDWSDINQNIGINNTHVIYEVHRLYNGSMDDIDYYVAGLIESGFGQMNGSTFSKIIKDQFERIRKGDRFWFENKDGGWMLNDSEITQIKATTFKDVIMKATGLSSNDLQDNVFQWLDGDGCRQPSQLKEGDMEACSPLRMHDFMNGSEVGYVCSFTACALMPLICILVAYIIAKYKEHMITNQKPLSHGQRSVKYKNDAKLGIFTAVEWQGEKQPPRTVILRVDGNESKVHVMSSNQIKLRVVDFSDTNCVPIWISNDYNNDMALIYVPKEYDLVLRFASKVEREDFLMYLQAKLQIRNIMVQIREQSRKLIMVQAVTKEKRTKLIESFFKSMFAEALKLDVDMKLDDIKIEQRREIMQCELSKAEFAEALALAPNSSFVDYMFSLLDRDMNGYLSFKELLHVVIMFSKGSPEEKLETLFNMYDTDKNGTLDIAELRGMIRSFLDIANSDLTDEAVEALVTEMFGAAGLSDTSSITFPEFCSVLQHRKLSTVGLDWRGVGRSKPVKTKSKGQKNKKDKKPGYKTQTSTDTNAGGRSPRMSSASESEGQPRSLNEIDFAEVVMENQRYHPVKARLMAFQRYIENNRQRIVVLLLFFAFSFGISIERFYFYTWNQEHVGLRRFATIGVSFSRGAAAGMSFTYSFILLTMCRNIITKLRSTFVNLYIPFDSHVAFHKVVAWTALFFTAVHVLGYGFNLYHIVTQPSKHLCMVKEFGFRTDPPPGIAFWAFATLAGFTGVLLILVLSIIYVFATQTARKYIFNAFWTSHKLYYLMYLLTFLHGATRVVQNPYFWYYFVGPGVLYALDMMVSLSESKKKIAVIRADLLPSRVMCLEFKRPATFEYMSGQWVRIACLEHGENEYHPFTLTSAPHEETLSVHIRAVGPWTNNLRTIFNPDNLKNKPYPKLYIDGPYGAGQQDWFKYDCSVLVGGGIGVTPYASILKDFVYMSSSRHAVKIRCQKVYFIWVTASQRHYEWLIDILKQVEDQDEHQIVQNHIFITQFFQNFDFRTAMLYLCEEQFQKISHKSLFTGLRARTHFGRPQFDKFLSAVSDAHPKVHKVGVFSCGPPGLTKGVEKACFEASKITKALFEHHFENF